MGSKRKTRHIRVAMLVGAVVGLLPVVAVGSRYALVIGAWWVGALIGAMIGGVSLWIANFSLGLAKVHSREFQTFLSLTMAAASAGVLGASVWALSPLDAELHPLAVGGVGSLVAVGGTLLSTLCAPPPEAGRGDSTPP